MRVVRTSTTLSYIREAFRQREDRRGCEEGAKWWISRRRAAKSLVRAEPDDPQPSEGSEVRPACPRGLADPEIGRRFGDRERQRLVGSNGEAHRLGRAGLQRHPLRADDGSAGSGQCRLTLLVRSRRRPDGPDALLRSGAADVLVGVEPTLLLRDRSREPVATERTVEVRDRVERRFRREVARYAGRAVELRLILVIEEVDIRPVYVHCGEHEKRADKVLRLLRLRRAHPAAKVARLRRRLHRGVPAKLGHPDRLAGRIRVAPCDAVRDRRQVLDLGILRVAPAPGRVLLREGVGVQIDHVVERLQPLYAGQALRVLLALARDGGAGRDEQLRIALPRAASHVLKQGPVLRVAVVARLIADLHTLYKPL